MYSKKCGMTLGITGAIVLIALLASMISTISCSPAGRSNCCRGTAFNADREQLEAAVAEFMQRPDDPSYNHTYGDVPIVNESAFTVNESVTCPGGVPSDEDYYVIAICPLLTSSEPMGILRNVPATAHPKNCFPDGANAQPGVTACMNQCVNQYTGHYLWLTTLNGDVASICLGEECEEHGEDGFQCVYP